MTITENCTGCGACSLSCPKKCIEMVENRFGEMTPYIDEKNCIHCNLCQRVCPQNIPLPSSYPQECYVAWSKEDDDLIDSASGGVASVISKFQINNAGAVYGCDYDENMILEHYRIMTVDDIQKAKTSKYSQSKAFIVFEEIKEMLIHGEPVVFIGTPCQVAGLIKYLKTNYDNLITVDLVCHGTPPNRYLIEHLKSLKKYKNSTNVRFRGKYDQQLTIWNGNEIIYQKPKTADTYFSAFYSNMISRKSCYFCSYAKPERVSDITIGDFWGLGELSTVEKQSARPSLVLINSKRGKAFFDLVKEKLIWEERSVKEGISGNGRLNKPPYMNPKAKFFRALYPILGFEKSIDGSILLSNIRSNLIKMYK